MDLKEFKSALENTLLSNETCSFTCLCRISYSGRAEAELDEGERLIIIKSDNTLLVHQDVGSNPVNYMKADTKIDLLEIKDDSRSGILIQTHNQKYKDYLDIFVTKVFDFSSRKLDDGKKLVLVGTEKDMSDMIKDNPGVISSDFKPLSREEHTRYGFIDVFGHDDKGNLVIIECKRYVVGLSAVQQLRRYVEKMVELKGLSADKIKGIVAAPSITVSAESMLRDWGFEFKMVEPPKRLEKYNKSQKSLGEF